MQGKYKNIRATISNEPCSQLAPSSSLPLLLLHPGTGSDRICHQQQAAEAQLHSHRQASEHADRQTIRLASLGSSLPWLTTNKLLLLEFSANTYIYNQHCNIMFFLCCCCCFFFPGKSTTTRRIARPVLPLLQNFMRIKKCILLNCLSPPSSFLN